jgi:hypothetical protein
MKDNCKLPWCNQEAYGTHPFCSYHWGKLSYGFQGQRAKITAIRPARKNGWKVSPEFTAAVQEAVDWLTQEHETLVDCPKCKGRGINQGHSSYLRGKVWCDKGKRPKIS